jgi:hypothetical protein
MKKLPVCEPRAADLSQAGHIIEMACHNDGLTLVLKGSLATFAGCTHWHYKNGAARGTLEITFWPSKRKIWFSVQSGRRADWIDEHLEGLRKSSNTD